LPLALTASTLGAWLTDAGVDKRAIGLFAAVATPYTLKFLWAPLIDGLRVPVLSRMLGRRRGWLLATQLALVAAILALGMADPAVNPWLTAAMALLVAICSASQDIVIDAYRVEILTPEQYGAGAAMNVFGYRLGMIASSAVPLYFYGTLGWHTVYMVMAALMGVGMLATLLGREPPARDEETQKVPLALWLRLHVIDPFADFMQRPHWLGILLFILLYKLADAFMGVMTNPFLLNIGFTGPQIATILKIYGVAATIIGGFIGGAMVYRIGMVRSLWVCGIAHGLTNLMFVAQAHIGPDTHFLTLAITLENISGGMGVAAFVAFMSSLCNTRFTGTQYALLSSFAAFGRTWLSTPAGWVADQLGWAGFFTFAALLAIPGLAVLLWLMRQKNSNMPIFIN
jgi:PAT family beta-lactamase induction signal transducer AmpG